MLALARSPRPRRARFVALPLPQAAPTGELERAAWPDDAADEPDPG